MVESWNQKVLNQMVVVNDEIKAINSQLETLENLANLSANLDKGKINLIFNVTSDDINNLPSITQVDERESNVIQQESNIVNAKFAENQELLSSILGARMGTFRYFPGMVETVNHKFEIKDTIGLRIINLLHAELTIQKDKRVRKLTKLKNEL